MTPAAILAAHRTVTQEVDTGGPAPIVATHEGYDAAAIGADLAGRPAGQEALVVDTLRAALAAGCAPLPLVRQFTQAQLEALAAAPGGERVLLDVVAREMPESVAGLYVTEATRVEVRSIYRAVAAAENARSGTIGVEVLTFAHGASSALDTAGETVFRSGVRGHTALIVGGLVYSFDERGWAPEGTKAEYLARQERDAVGQVIDMPRADAARIQEWLIGQLGVGVYLVNAHGNVCCDEAAIALQSVLGRLDPHHSPQQFRWLLEASGHVTATNTYPNPHAPPGYAPPTDAAEKLAVVQSLFRGYVSDEDLDAVEQAYRGNASDRSVLQPEIERAIPTLHNAGQQVRLCRLISASSPTKIVVMHHLFATWVTDENIHQAATLLAIDPADRPALQPAVDDGIRSLISLDQQVAAVLELHPSAAAKADVIRRALRGYVTDADIAQIGEIYRLDPGDQAVLRPVIETGIESLFSDRQKALLRNVLTP
jgi:hypothetical protein